MRGSATVGPVRPGANTIDAAIGTPRRPPPGSRWFLERLGDAALVARVAGGSATAFEVLYERHTRGLLAFARHVLGSREEAEDVVQRTFATAYRAIRAGDAPEQPRAWLYAVARNDAISVLRARRAAPAPMLAVSTEGLAEEVERRAELRELIADLQRLPDDQRGALVLAELGDLSHGEIARVLDVAEPKVKALVFQARSHLLGAREARDASCREIRTQLATLRGGRLNDRRIRQHVGICAGCAEYREALREQRRRLGVLLPVLPSIALKGSVLGALGIGGASHASAGGSVAAWVSRLRPRGQAAKVTAGGTAGAAVVVAAALAVLGGGDRRAAPPPAAAAAPRPVTAAPPAPRRARGRRATPAPPPAPARIPVVVAQPAPAAPAKPRPTPRKPAVAPTPPAPVPPPAPESPAPAAPAPAPPPAPAPAPAPPAPVQELPAPPAAPPPPPPEPERECGDERPPPRSCPRPVGPPPGHGRDERPPGHGVPAAPPRKH